MEGLKQFSTSLSVYNSHKNTNFQVIEVIEEISKDYIILAGTEYIEPVCGVVTYVAPIFFKFG